MVRWACIKCGWEYHDTPGMGIHRVPHECPECGGKVLGRTLSEKELTGAKNARTQDQKS